MLSDPDPVPATTERRYPYFRYDGSTDVPERRTWKTVTLESDRLAVTILPEVGGKVWGAYDKVAKRDFLYANHVMKFRDIAMRGPWTSGGIEFNFGVIGHSPCTSTPVDWHVRTNGDGSASCFVGGIAQMLSTAEEYLRRFPSKNPLQIGYARALMKLGRHRECMDFLKGVKILPSEHRDSATDIWQDCPTDIRILRKTSWP